MLWFGHLSDDPVRHEHGFLHQSPEDLAAPGGRQVGGLVAIGSIRAADLRGKAACKLEEGGFLMRAENHSSAWALAITTFVAVAAALFITYGIGAVLIATVVVLLVVSYFVHRYMDADLPDHYSRHGDRMD
jgi:hypothetical protein